MSNITSSSDAWETVTIGDIVTFEYGKALRKDKRDPAGNIPVFGSNGIVGYHSKALVTEPCLIVGRKGAAGEVHISPGPCWPIDTTYYVVPPKDVNLRFLYYQLKFKNLSTLDRSTAIPGLNRNDAYAVEIAIRSTDEQEKIVSKIESLFTQLDAATAALKRVQANLKRYKASVLKAACEGRLVPTEAELARKEGRSYESGAELLERILKERRRRWEEEQRQKGKDPAKMKYPEPAKPDTEGLPELPEGWTWATVGQIGVVKGGKRLPKNHVYSTEKTEFAYIRVIDFEDFSINTENLKYLERKTQEKIVNYKISSRDVYISIAGSIGKVGTVPKILDGANLTENAAKVTDLRINTNYLAYALGNMHSQNQIAKLTISTNQPKLALFRIEKIAIPLPPLIEQKRIVRVIEETISSIKFFYQCGDSDLKRAGYLYQSILRNAFQGRLDKRG